MIKLVFKLFCMFVLISLFLTACSQNTPVEENKEPLSVFFCPRQNCAIELENGIRDAKEYAYCAFYDLSLESIIDALADQSQKIDVKLVIDSSTYSNEVLGDAIRMDDNNQLMHNKFCVIDGVKVITGSMNPTFNDNFRNKNNLIILNSEYLAKNYLDEFEELWNGNFGSGTKVKTPMIILNGVKIENYFCPEDGCAKAAVKTINSAEKSINFMTFSFTSKDIADSIIEKKDIRIQGIFDASQAGSEYSQFERLDGLGFDVKKENASYKLHHKVFIIDNSTVITGSFNPTQSGDSRNDENLLIIHDKTIAALFTDEFEKLSNNQ